MHRFPFALALAAALCALTPAPGWAQANNMTVVYDPDGEEDIQTGRLLRIGAPECEQDIDIEFRLSQTLDIGEIQNRRLEIWRGQNCSAPEGRAAQEGTCATARCDFITDGTAGTSNISIRATAKALFGGPDGECPTSETTPVIHIVAVPEADPQCSNPREDLLEGQTNAQFTVRTNDPPSPGDVQVRDGSSTFSVSWGRGAGGESTNEFIVIAAPVEELDGGADCPAIWTGDEAPAEGDLPEGVTVIMTDGRNATLSAEELGVDYGERIAASVITVDVFGNRSDPTAPDCATRIRSTGLVGAFEDSAGRDVQTCSAGAVKSRDAALGWLAPLALAGLLCWGRARRREAARSAP